MAEISEILTKLATNTDLGKVAWKTTANEQAFTAAVGNLSVVILTDKDGDPVLRILDSSGREIDKLEGWTHRERENELSNLHAKARRIALAVNSKLDDLMRALETGT